MLFFSIPFPLCLNSLQCPKLRLLLIATLSTKAKRKVTSMVIAILVVVTIIVLPAVIGLSRFQFPRSNIINSNSFS